MARTISFQDKKLTLLGRELSVGDTLPSFKVVGNDMSDITESFLTGKTAIVATVPSVDTPVCSIELKRFNKELEALSGNVILLAVSMDLPFAQKRWCGAEGVTKVTTASDFKYRSVGEGFGTHIQEWGLLSRALFVTSAQGKLTYVEYVPEVAQEPNYEAALKAVKAAL